MTTCRILNINPICHWCIDNEDGRNCYVYGYVKRIRSYGWFENLKHVQEHPRNSIYYIAALKSSYPQYVDRAEKLLVLL